MDKDQLNSEQYKKELINELCAKLPYKIIAHVKKNNKEFDGRITSIKGDYILILYDGVEAPYHINYIKPYFRHFSSITDNELHKLEKITNIIKSNILEINQLFDFLNSHYFDTRNFIGKDLALEAKADFYYINND